MDVQELCKDHTIARVSADIEVAEYAGQLFFRLWRASHTRTAAALEALGLTPALFALLNVLGAHEGAIQQEIGSSISDTIVLGSIPIAEPISC